MPLSLGEGVKVSACVRWGADGFALLGKNDRLYFFRWSGAVPVAVQSSALATGQAAAPSVVQTSVQLLGMQLALHLADMTALIGASRTADFDGDGISDGLEYLFGTSPSAFTENPLMQKVVSEQGGDVIHVRFPRRVGLVMPAYRYETSDDLVTWSSLPGVEETVISSREVDGVMIENVDAVIRIPLARACSIRLSWNP
jgi:hypothetical protein